jgi:hypothetical protein
MKNLAIKSKQLLTTVSDLEKKHKIITYLSLLFLTVSTYFLRTENQDIKIDYATLQERNISLQNNMIIFNRSYENFPLPVWQKVKRGNQFIIQYVNPKFMEFFGHTVNNDLYNVIGKNNFEIFPKNIAQIYYENDIAVSITGDDQESIEKFIDKDGVTKNLRVMKWRSIRDNKDTLVYGMVKEIIGKKIKN